MVGVIGKRVRGLEPYEFKPGEYGRWAKDDNHWYARTPDGNHLANLSGHKVQENVDGTISVRESILVRGGTAPHWHGFLKLGVWQQLDS